MVHDTYKLVWQAPGEQMFLDASHTLLMYDNHMGIIRVEMPNDHYCQSNDAQFCSLDLFSDDILTDVALGNACIDVCPICRDVPNDAVTTICKHVFCKGCIEKWLVAHSTCPMCMQSQDKLYLQSMMNDIGMCHKN
jgi:hypothetical protein